MAQMCWAQDHKTQSGDQTQISSIWLAEMPTGRHFSQSDAWDLSLVSNLSFMILGPGWSVSTVFVHAIKVYQWNKELTFASFMKVMVILVYFRLPRPRIVYIWMLEPWC
jgi:hypothetical protein